MQLARVALAPIAHGALSPLWIKLQNLDVPKIHSSCTLWTSNRLL